MNARRTNLRTAVAVVALSCTLAAVTSATGEATSAWWLNARFTPLGNEIVGLSVDQIDASWVRASALQDLPLPAEASAPGESVVEHGGSFSLNQDFDSDGVAESVIVGVYETRSGGVGRFLLVLSRRASGTPAIRARFLSPGVAGFSVLMRDGKRVMWATCMECDVFSIIKYEAGKFSLEHESCEDCG